MTPTCFQAHEYRSVPYRIAGVACRIATRATVRAVSAGQPRGRYATAQQKLTTRTATATQKATGSAENSPRPALITRATFVCASAMPHATALTARPTQGTRAGRPARRTAGPGRAWLGRSGPGRGCAGRGCGGAGIGTRPAKGPATRPVA